MKKLSLLALMCISSLSYATTINTMNDVTDSVARYMLKSPEVLKSLRDIGLFYEDKLERGTDCLESVNITPVSMGLISPITFDFKDAYPREGIWTVRFKFERCNQSSLYSVLFNATNGGQPKATALYPGESLADPRLYVDALTPAIMAIRAQWPKCEDFYISDTKVLAEPLNNAWSEAWTFYGCKQFKTLNVNFTPAKDGGTDFAISNSK